MQDHHLPGRQKNLLQRTAGPYIWVKKVRRGDIGPEAVAPGERVNPISRDMTTTLRDNHLAATALDDLGRLWAAGGATEA